MIYNYDDILEESLSAQKLISKIASIPKTVSAIILNLNEWHKTRFKAVYGMNEEANIIFRQVNQILGSNAAERKAHKNDIVNLKMNNVYLKNTSNKKEYQLKYNEFYFDVNTITTSIKNKFDTYDQSNKEEVKMFIDELVAYDKMIHNWYMQYHWYIDKCDPFIEKHIQKHYLENSIKYLKIKLENYYAMMYNAQNITSTEIIYLQALNKAYSEMCKICVDKNIQKSLDSLYGFIIEKTEKSCYYNMSIFDKVFEAYEEEYHALEDIYKSFNK